MKRKRAMATTVTTVERLNSIIKSCRDIMRTDKGLNGDLDRLPMLTWIMFLKFLDDKEEELEDRATLAGQAFRPTLEAPYRWRDWAADDAGITGDELIAFINNDEAMRPDGLRGAGLFAYLRGLRSANSRDRLDVIARVFEGIQNRMISGYLLRDILSKVNEIQFGSSEEKHTLSLLYEIMLKEMRDAAGDSGEFYTPRPVVKFMVTASNPQLGEKILDPACGTGGFLVESFEHLQQKAETVEDRKTLQTNSIFGGEAKPLPYLLAQMNLLLHGMEHPQIDYGNSLGVPLRDIRDDERVDVILTNPPFGGEEEKGVLGNFPKNKQTAETAFLFLQLIMRKLKRNSESGRAAVIVPNGTLFADGVAARIKEDLMADFNLHTIVRFPEGVFTPHTKIHTNILFFDKSSSTTDIWFYELSLPEGYRRFTKTKPMQPEHLQHLQNWWTNRVENDNSWKVKASDVLQYDKNGKLLSANLDISNPNAEDPFALDSPFHLVANIRSNQTPIAELLQSTYRLLQSQSDARIDFDQYPLVPIGKFAQLVKRPVELVGEVKSVGVKLWGKGAYVAEIKPASKFRAARFEVKINDLIYNDMWARHGSVAIVPPELDGCVGSAHFPTWEIDLDLFYPQFLQWCFRSPWFWRACSSRSQGSTGRNAITKTLFREILLPCPPIPEQRAIDEQLDDLQQTLNRLLELQNQTSQEMEMLLSSVLDHSLTNAKQ